MKALSIDVYRSQNRGISRIVDFTNGGITSKYSNLLLVCDEGSIDVDENNLPENLVKLVTKTIRGQECKLIEPVASVDSGCEGWLFGGNIAYSLDMRFTRMSKYPLCVYDRQEKEVFYDYE